MAQPMPHRRIADERLTILHTGVVLSGHGVVAYEDGQQVDLLPGQAFHITTHPHDSWVVGDQPYVSLHVLKTS
jgi:uncharacterized cupin superfamily protein